MSIDRRIVSILYHNGIDDVTKVEKFLGEKDNYYEVIIGGELKKLKIPGNEYFEMPTKQYLEEKIQEIDKNISNLEKKKEIFEQKTFEEELLEAEKESKNLENLFTTTVKTEMVEIKKDLKPKTTKPPAKKKEIKKLDDDIDDFIDTI